MARRGSGSNDWQAGLARLQEALPELDRLGAEGARSVEQEQIAAIDRKLKACRAVLAGGSREGSNAKAKAKADKAARKAAKAAEQRSAVEASLGITTAAPAAAGGLAAPDAAAAGAEQPPAKRQRQADA